jgi:hypothetical protein
VAGRSDNATVRFTLDPKRQRRRPALEFTKMKKFALTTALAALTLPAASGPAMAQTAGWEFAISPYVWLPGISTSTETGRGSIDADSSTSSVIEDLDFAFMGTFQAQKGRWGLILDLLNADLSSNKSTPLGALWSDAEVQTSVTAFTTYAGYRAFENSRGSVDVLGGARFFTLDIDTSLSPGLLPGRDRSVSADWADPVLGLRGRFDFNDKWFATGLADYGGFDGGSDQSWQLFASVGYEFNQRWSMQGGWRYLAIEKEINGQDVEVDLNGPLIGFTVRF